MKTATKFPAISLEEFRGFIRAGYENCAIEHYRLRTEECDALREALRDLIGKIEVMGGCNSYDFDVACSDEAWPEFKRAHELLGEDV